jgi:hypothetical protein
MPRGLYWNAVDRSFAAPHLGICHLPASVASWHRPSHPTEPALRSLILVLMLSLLTACATGEKVRGSVHEGMPKAAVIDLLGKPDGFRREGSIETLQYVNRLISGWSWDRTDYAVILTDGVVTEYGHGEVQQAPTGGFFIYTAR